MTKPINSNPRPTTRRKNRLSLKPATIRFTPTDRRHVDTLAKLWEQATGRRPSMAMIISHALGAAVESARRIGGLPGGIPSK